MNEGTPAPEPEPRFSLGEATDRLMRMIRELPVLPPKDKR